MRVFRSLFGSKFKAQKTPPSHGLTGFVAIEVVAKNAGLRRAGGGCETGCLAAVMQGAPGEMLRAFALQAARETGLAGGAYA